MLKEPKWVILALALLLGMTLGLLLPRGGDRAEPVETETEAASAVQDEEAGGLQEQGRPSDEDDQPRSWAVPQRSRAVPQIEPGQVCDPGKDEDCRDMLEMEELGSDGPLGGRCETAANCASPWQCLGPPDHPHFLGGHCGLSNCESDDECGSQGICAEACGGTYCLRECTPHYCRRGYACRRVRDEERACVPRCGIEDDDPDWFFDD